MRKEKGITLIALVVTIVVLLILAAVSISLLTGENGIITQAQNSKEETEIGEEKEQVQLAATAAKGKTNWGEITEDNFREELDNNIGSGNYTLSKNGDIFTVTYNDSGRSYEVDGNGNVTLTNTETEISIKLTVTYENKKLNANELPNVKEVTNENVPIPKGFYYVGGTKNEGVVISDVQGDDLNNNAKGNQFVWVPVNQNQKLILEVTSKENIKEIIVTHPNLEKTVIGESGKKYKNEIQIIQNGIYKVEVKTETTSKIAREQISSLYGQDIFVGRDLDSMLEIYLDSIKESAKENYNSVSELLEEKGVDSIETLLSENGYSSMSEYMVTEEIYIEELKNELEPFILEYLQETISEESKKYEDFNQNTESVNKYGGFYIARYEAGDGISTSNRNPSTSDVNPVVSKKGAYVYDFISANNAKNLANEMYNENDAVVSQVIAGAGWDRTLNWIIETGGKSKEEIINSNSWGNYSDSTGNAAINSGEENMNHTTGRSEYWKSNNIYDLAGNTSEYTQEKQGGDYIDRGGDYKFFDGINTPVSSRHSISPDYESSSTYSFRIQLFINI